MGASDRNGNEAAARLSRVQVRKVTDENRIEMDAVRYGGDQEVDRPGVRMHKRSLTGIRVHVVERIIKSCQEQRCNSAPGDQSSYRRILRTVLCKSIGPALENPEESLNSSSEMRQRDDQAAPGEGAA